MDYIKVYIMNDKEANVWIAINHDIGLFLENDDLAYLITRVENAVPDMVECNFENLVRKNIIQNKDDIEIVLEYIKITK